jgi:hypothetical protein
MDNTINPDEIANVLKQFDRQKESEKYVSTGNAAKEIVSSIGTDTPLTVLLDIRQLLTEINHTTRDHARKQEEAFHTIIDIMSEQRAVGEQRHRETLAFINKMSESSGREYSPRSTGVSPHMKSISLTDSDGRYYYKGDEIKTNQSIIACFLIHLDVIVSKALPLSDDITDTSVMELKDWSSAVTILREVESSVTPNPGVLSFPKKNAEESINTLDVIASPVPGRTTVCKNEHIHSLIVNCPTISRCVEEIRQRALLCPGIVGSSRLRNLAALSYPYVLKDGVLNITNTAPKPMGSAVLHERVKQMNSHQKKIYAQLILGAPSKKPIVASSIALDCKIDFKKWRESREH